MEEELENLRQLVEEQEGKIEALKGILAGVFAYLDKSSISNLLDQMQGFPDRESSDEVRVSFQKGFIQMVDEFRKLLRS
ncbi:MAG: hypothetical protein F4223_10345 [Rhodobacteraceae bacterium]|nr:hypothetical protein [Paracoccaceae bacterium]